MKIKGWKKVKDGYFLGQKDQREIIYRPDHPSDSRQGIRIVRNRYMSDFGRATRPKRIKSFYDVAIILHPPAVGVKRFTSLGKARDYAERIMRENPVLRR